MKVHERSDSFNSREIDTEVWEFPGGEVGVKLKVYDNRSRFTVSYTAPKTDNVLVLLNILDALKNQGVEKHNIVLVMPYLPYARQDRACNQGESFALDVFLKVLSTGHFGELIVYDLHSQVSSSLIHKYMRGVTLTHVEQADLLSDQIEGFNYIVAPDKGAEKKAKVVSELLDIPLIQMYKARVDGQVIYSENKAQLSSSYKGNALVVDDICDGGATFLALAKALKYHNPDLELSLYVTHGIFSKGVDDLLKSYAIIYTSNLLNESVSNQVKEFYK